MNLFTPMNAITWMSVDKERFQLTEEANKEILKLNNPQMILVVGLSRNGKSTFCNQMVTGQFNPGSPFKSDSGRSSVTHDFQAYIIKRSEFNKNMKYDKIISDEDDCDLVIVDSEGFGDIYANSDFLTKGIAILQQISTVTVLFSRTGLNAETYPKFKSQMSFSKFIGQDKTLVEGFVTVAANVGISDKFKDFHSQELERQRQDEEEKKIILSLLDNDGIIIPKDLFKAIVQPNFRDDELFWNANRDFCIFVNKMIDSRQRMCPKSFISLFNSFSAKISSMSAFDQSGVDFEAIIKTMILNEIRSIRDKLVYDSKELISFHINEVGCDSANHEQELVSFKIKLKSDMATEYDNHMKQFSIFRPEERIHEIEIRGPREFICEEIERHFKADFIRAFPKNWNEYLISSGVTHVAIGSVIQLHFGTVSYDVVVTGVNQFRVPSITVWTHYLHEKSEWYESGDHVDVNNWNRFPYNFDPDTLSITINGARIDYEHYKRKQNAVFGFLHKEHWEYWQVLMQCGGPWTFVNTEIECGEMSPNEIMFRPHHRVNPDYKKTYLKFG